MIYEEEEKIFESLEYQGNRLNCKFCKHSPKIRKDDVTKYTACKMIDHDKVRFLPQIFNGYDGTIATQNICGKYEVANWDNSGKKEWRGIEAYIEFMDKFYYMTASFVKYNIIRDVQHVTLVTGEGKEGDWNYQVSLYDWLTGNVFNEDGSINYRKKIKITRTARTIKREVVDYRGIFK